MAKHHIFLHIASLTDHICHIYILSEGEMHLLNCSVSLGTLSSQNNALWSCLSWYKSNPWCVTSEACQSSSQQKTKQQHKLDSLVAVGSVTVFVIFKPPSCEIKLLRERFHQHLFCFSSCLSVTHIYSSLTPFCLEMFCISKCHFQPVGGGILIEP